MVGVVGRWGSAGAMRVCDMQHRLGIPPMISPQLNWQLRGIAAPKINVLLQYQDPLLCGVSDRIFTGREDTLNQSVLFLGKGLWSVPPKNFFFRRA